MTTGAFWDVTNPLKPWGIFDPDAQLNIPFDWAAWLADAGATYVSHTLTCDPVLEVVADAEQAGVVMALVHVKAGQTPSVGTKYFVTCHIVATAGSMTLEDDRTVWLKMVER